MCFCHMTPSLLLLLALVLVLLALVLVLCDRLGCLALQASGYQLVLLSTIKSVLPCPFVACLCFFRAQASQIPLVLVTWGGKDRQGERA